MSSEKLGANQQKSGVIVGAGVVRMGWASFLGDIKFSRKELT
jgi:hypothetical protein